MLLLVCVVLVCVVKSTESIVQRVGLVDLYRKVKPFHSTMTAAGYREVRVPLLGLEDAGKLLIIGDADSSTLMFCTGGFPDDHRAFLPLGRRLVCQLTRRRAHVCIPSLALSPALGDALPASSALSSLSLSRLRGDRGTNTSAPSTLHMQPVQADECGCLVGVSCLYVTIVMTSPCTSPLSCVTTVSCLYVTIVMPSPCLVGVSCLYVTIVMPSPFAFLKTTHSRVKIVPNRTPLWLALIQ